MDHHFRLLAEAMPQIVWSARPDGFTESYNSRWFEYTGLTLQESRGWGWRHVLHPDDLEACCQRWARALETGAAYEVEYRFRRADGLYRWHLGRALPLRNADGHIVKWLGTCTDIDDQKRAERERAQLAAREESRVAVGAATVREIARLSAIIETQHQISSAALDVNRVMKIVVDRTLELTGADSSVIEIADGDEMVYRFVGGTATAHLGLRLPIASSFSGRCFTSRETLCCVDSELDDRVDRDACRRVGARAMLCVPLMHDENVVGVLKVLSGRAHAFGQREIYTLQLLGGLIAAALMNAAKFEAEERFRILVDALKQHAIFMLDPAGHIVTWNLGAERLTGYTSAETVGRHISRFQTHDDSEQAVSKLDAALRQASAVGRFEEEAWRLRRDGRRFWANIVISSVRDADGKLTGFATIMRDETEHKELESRLLLSDRMASLGTLAAGVAHEINNPLGAAVANLGYLSGLVPELPLPERDKSDIAETLADSREALDRVRVIVRDLKTLSRGEDDKLALIDVNRVLDTTAQLAANEIKHRARLVKDFATGLPSIDANEARLGQVFLNLLVNAAQSIAEGHAERNQIRLVTRAADQGWIAIEVQDTGSGIAPDVLPKIFNPFFTTKDVGSGTGIGLSICHNIVSRLGGRIEIDTALGRGTTMRVLLPGSTGERAPPATPPPDASETVGDVARARIMVIDDDEAVCRALRRVLQGYDVTTFNHGGEALARLAAGDTFDLILCDLMMPELTGMDVYAALMERNPQQARQIVFITGGAFTPRTKAFLDEVQSLRIEKPFDFMALQALIRERMLKPR